MLKMDRGGVDFKSERRMKVAQGCVYLPDFVLEVLRIWVMLL
jgi:hypothetical protein